MERIVSRTGPIEQFQLAPSFPKQKYLGNLIRGADYRVNPDILRSLVVPRRKRVRNHTQSYRDMINSFLPRVERPNPSSRYGWVKVDYEYKDVGRALAAVRRVLVLGDDG